MLRHPFTFIGNFWYALLNLLYPQNCLICNYKLETQRPSLICETCRNKIDSNAAASAVRDDDERYASAPKRPGYDTAFYVTTYDDAVKRCIHLFKYEGKVKMVNLLGKLMVDFARKNIDIDEIDLIVPMPLHPLKLREREFNQSELLASYLAKGLNKKIVKDKVGRIKYTMPQTELRREERLKNVKDAFLAKRCGDFKGSAILLVDDVLTTGATFSECAKSLKDAGAKKVVAFALARGN